MNEINSGTDTDADTDINIDTDRSEAAAMDPYLYLCFHVPISASINRFAVGNPTDFKCSLCAAWL